MKTGTIEQTFQFTASPAEVFDAYTDPDKQSAFTGDEASGKAKAGQKFTAYGDYISGKYISLVKNKKIVQEWKTAEWPENYPPSLLTITLEPSKKGTVLHLLHTSVPQSQLESYRQGWIEHYWEPMEEYFKTKK